MTYSIRLPDGTLVENIPDEITPEAAKARIIESMPQYAQKQEAKEESGFLRQAADIPLKLGTGAVQGVRMIADAFGAGSDVSNTIKGVEGYLSGLMSAESKRDSAAVARIMKDAEDKGAGEQVRAALSAFAQAPADLLAQGLGTAAPVIVGTLGAKFLGAGALAMAGVQTAAGALMGAGTVKGTIYEETKKALSEVGIPEKIAESTALKAQEYGGKNLDQILIGAGIGAIAGRTGIEKSLTSRILGNALGKQAAKEAAATAAPGLIRRTTTGAISEAAPEFVQAGQEQLAANIAQQREGLATPTLRGVVGSGALEAMAGAGLGAAFEAAPQRAPAAPAAEAPPAPVERPVTRQPLEIFPGTISPESVDAITAGYPEPIRQALRTEFSGRTLEQLKEYVRENPDILSEDGYGTRTIRALLGQPAVEPSAGVPVQPGPAVAAAPEAPAPIGLAPVETPVVGPDVRVAEQPSPLDVQVPTEAVPPAGAAGELSAAGPAPVEAAGVEPVEVPVAPVAEQAPEPVVEPIPAPSYEMAWDAMPAADREAMALLSGIKQIPATNAAAKAWADLTPKQRERIASVLELEPAPVAELPEATAPQDQQPKPEPDLAAEQKALESLEAERRKIRRGPGANLRSVLIGKLPADEVRDISPSLAMRPLQAAKGKKPSGISTFVANGALDAFLPPNMRSDSIMFDEQEAVEYIKEQLRSGNHYSFETQMQLAQLDLTIQEVEKAMREHLDLEETNLLIQEAADEQRRIDQEAEAAIPEGEAGVAEAAPAAAEEEVTEEPVLQRPTRQSLEEIERRAAEAEAEAQKARSAAEKLEADERTRKEIEQRSAAAADTFELGQTAEENLTGQKDLLAQPAQPAAQTRMSDEEYLDRFELDLRNEILPFRAISKGRYVVIRPRPLTDRQVALLLSLAKDAIDLGMPAHLLFNVSASGATGIQSLASVTTKSGYLMLGSQWAGVSRAEKLHTLIHELAHTADIKNGELGAFSDEPSWAKAHEELRDWFVNSPVDERMEHPMRYPFLPSFARQIMHIEAESYAQAFSYYFVSPAKLQANAPYAYDQIQKTLERIKNEQRPTTAAGIAAGITAPGEIQPARTGKGAEVQPVARAERAGVAGTERAKAGAAEEVRSVKFFEDIPNKSAIGNVGTYKDVGDILMMESAPDIPIEEIARRNNVFGDGVITTWTYPTESKFLGASKDNIIYTMQNKYIDLVRAQEGIRSAGREIGEQWDAVMKETLFHGRTAKRAQELLRKVDRDILETMRQRNVGKRELGEYLHNRHAPEANAVIASRNPKFPDGGSGIMTADAMRYMQELDPKKKADLQAVADKVDALMKSTRDMIIESGMEPVEVIETWESVYPNYIPLVREDADYSVGKSMTQGAGFSVTGETTKGRTGSAREVNHDHILSNIIAQQENIIARAEKERVAKAIYGLAVQNPNPGFWLALDPTADPIWQSQETADAIALLEDVASSEELTQEEAEQYANEIARLTKKLNALNKKYPAALEKLRADLVDLGIDPANAENIMKPPLKPRYDRKTGRVVYEASAAYNNPSALGVRFNGTDKFVLFNAKDPRAKRMVEALKNMDADQLGTAMSMVAKVTRYFAAINTQYNPIFGAYNFLRDVQSGLLQLSTTPIADQKKKVMAGVGPALSAIYKSTRAVTKKQDIKAGEWGQLWEEFQQEGGQTGFRDVFTQRDERARALQRMLDPSSWADSGLGRFFTIDGRLKAPLEMVRKSALSPVFDWLSDYNTSMENAVRLSAYKAAKDKFSNQGMTDEEAKQRAAVVAKELTVNFNRKGQVATQMGALYAFFNASVQGTTRLYQTLTGPIGKKILAGSFLLGSMQALLLASAGFDDDEPPGFVKERNLVIPIGAGKYITIPLPLGYNVLPNISRIVTETAINGWEGKPLNISKRVEQIVSSLFDMFNPIGNAGLSVQSIAPTIADPLVALTENKDWTGKPIAKKDMSDLKPTPGYMRAKESATWLSEQLAYYLNLASGGTDRKQGIISPTPDQLDYIIGQITGGLGREVQKLAKTAETAITGEELPDYSIPIWGRFVGDIRSSAAVSNRFYDNVKMLNEHAEEIKGLRENRGNVSSYVQENPEARLANFGAMVYRDVSELRRRRRDLVEQGAPREKVKQVEERIKNRMKQLNDKIEALEKR